MNASAQPDDGAVLSLKTKFVYFMKLGNHGKEIEDYKEIEEGLLFWAKMRCQRVKIRCEPVEAHQNHMGSLHKPLEVAKSRERRRDVSPLRPTKRAREESEERLDKKRQARSRERSRERSRDRSWEWDKSRERAHK